MCGHSEQTVHLGRLTFGRPWLLFAGLLAGLAYPARSQEQIHTFKGKDFWWFGDMVSLVGDADGDGYWDVVVAGDMANSCKGVARLYSGRTGDRMDTWRGLDHARLGWAARGRRDFDGDGLPDVLLSAPFESYIGSVYVYSGVTGDELIAVVGDPTTSGFGEGAGTLGDVDGDGVPDLIVGTPNFPWGVFSGRAQVFSGATGTEILSIDGEFRSEFGNHVCDMGDVDGDGRGDFAVGAALDGSGMLGSAGSITVFSGATGVQIEKIYGERAAGIGLCESPGDIDGDGTPDLLIGDPLYEWDHHVVGRNQYIGRLLLYSGATFERIDEWVGDPTSVLFGASFAGAGDVDRDGVPDIVAGTPGTVNHGGPWFGYAKIISGRTREPLYTFTNGGAADSFAHVVDGGGDVNMDGFADVVIGIPNDGDYAHGRANVYGGNDLFLDARPKKRYRVGELLTLNLASGPPGGLAAVLLHEVNDVRVDQWIDFGSFDRRGRFQIHAVVPPGLAGTTLDLIGYALGPSGNARTTVEERVEFY